MYESSEEQLMTSYAEQREARLQDAISEYTLEQDVTAEFAYNSIISAIKTDALYFKQQYDKQMSILLKMGYYGPLEDVPPIQAVPNLPERF